ncbi:MAG: Uma2 family endonuclease [Planctomycetota bacterium]
MATDILADALTESGGVSVVTPRPAPVYLDRSSSGMLMTPDEYDAVTDWDRDYRFELIRGVIAVSPAPAIGSRYPSDWFAAVLRAYSRTETGKTVMPITVSEHDLEPPNGRRRADRVIWCGLGRMPDFKRDVPQIAIEFVSETTRDRHRDFVEKRREYLELGVREYWIVDRFGRSLTVCTTPAGETGVTVVRAAGVYRTDLLPGFELKFDELLGEIDKVTG